MKKVLSLALAFVLAFALAIPTFAFAAVTDVAIDSDTNRPSFTTPTEDSITVDYTVKGAYTISIPADITVDAAAVESNKISVSGVYLGWKQTLTVSVKYDGVLSLVTPIQDASDADLSYVLKNGSTDIAVNNTTGTTVLTIQAGTTAGNTTDVITAQLTGTKKYAGVYNDTVTFIVAIATDTSTDANQG